MIWVQALEAMPIDRRKAAWFAAHDALPARSAVGRVTLDLGASPVHRRGMGAAPRGRGKIPVSVSGAADGELAALDDLHARFTGLPRPADDAAKRAPLDRRLRQALGPRRRGIC